MIIMGVIKSYIKDLFLKKGTTRSFNDFATQFNFLWEPKIKDACNHPRYEIFFDWNYSPILVSRNNWTIMNFLENGDYEVEYEHITITILGGDVTDV